MKRWFPFLWLLLVASAFHADGKVTSLVSRTALPNFSSIIHQYDSLSRLDFTALVNRWGHVLDGQAYGHDPAGLRTNITRYLGLTTNSVAVGYDAAGQLTRWSARENDGTPRLNEQLAWVYDKSGNLQYRTNNALAQAFLSDRANELTNLTRTGTLTVSGATPVPANGVSVNGQPAQRYDDFTFASAGHGLTGNDTFTIVATNAYGLRATNTLSTALPASVNLSYDLNGNLTNDGWQGCAYDGWNRLATNWVAGQWKVEHLYDGLSRRRISRDYRWDAGSGWVKTNETRYVYDGMLPIQERDETNGVRVSYVRGMDLSGTIHGAGGIGGLLARTDGVGSAYYHSDGAGNVTSLSDAQEGIAARYLYEPFGRLVGQWGPLADANAMRFSSKPRISPGGDLYDYGFRTYTTRLQRWTSRDPLGEAGGLNLYGFVGNSPVNAIDPWGLSPLASPLAAELYVGHAPPPSDLTAGEAIGFMAGNIVANIAAATGMGILAEAYGGALLAALGIAGAEAAVSPQGQKVCQTAAKALDSSAASVADKLERYLLNLEHPVGGPKAEWFKQALGFTRKNADDLAKQLVFKESEAVQTAVTQYGTQFNQIINVVGANGRTIPVTTAWIRGPDGVVKLVTAVPGN